MGGARGGGGSSAAVARGRRPRRLAFVLLLIPLLPLVLLAGAGSASAHAVLKNADPADGTLLRTAPKAVTLTFSESVGLLEDSVRVIDPGNRRVHTGRQEHAAGRANTARVTLPARLAQGTYIVAWRVVSADSHPASGALTFSVGERSATTAVLPSDTAQDAASTMLYDIARYVAYGGFALLLGTVVFTRVTGVAAAPGLLVGGWWTLMAATSALLLLRGPYERGRGPATALDLGVLRDTVTSRPGLALLARVVVLAVAAVALGRTGGAGHGKGRHAATVGLSSLALAVTWAVSEHAAAGTQVPLAMTSAVLHLLAMAVWLGGLAALLTALHRTPEALPPSAVARFSRLAFAAVVVLAATGAYQSWRGLGSFDALTSTTYGRLLTAKLVAVVVLLAAAASSRRWTARWAAAGAGAGAAGATLPERVRQSVGAATGRAVAAVPHEDHAAAGDGAAGDGAAGDGAAGDGAAGDGGAVDAAADAEPVPSRRELRRSVLAEVATGIVVLVITTLLTGAQPGRAAAEEAASRAAAEQPLGLTATVPFDMGTPGGRGRAQIELTPARAGENAVQALVFGPDGGIATVPELRLTFTLEERSIGPLDAKVTDRGGYWAAASVNLPLPGTWTMKATIRTTDVDQVTVSRRVRIG
ncbi:copper resistance CopC/CopD family protein [Streptomyces sp. NPDC007264]|uniref:copper resistance CopC/CopD family protein n=1 Tax=Streptomyces sp. NPDC007264 TaxID=3364777 RepID=UPI0036DB24CD